MDNTATASFMGVGEGKNQANTLFRQKPAMPDVEMWAKLPGKGNRLCFGANKGSDQPQQPLASMVKHHPISLKAPQTLAASTRGAQVGSPGFFDLSRLQSFAAYRNTLRNFSFILPFPWSSSSLQYQKQR